MVKPCEPSISHGFAAFRGQVEPSDVEKERFDRLEKLIIKSMKSYHGADEMGWKNVWNWCGISWGNSWGWMKLLDDLESFSRWHVSWKLMSMFPLGIDEIPRESLTKSYQPQHNGWKEGWVNGNIWTGLYKSLHFPIFLVKSQQIPHSLAVHKAQKARARACREQRSGNQQCLGPWWGKTDIENLSDEHVS